MIRKVLMPVIFIAVGAGLMYWLLGHHVVRTAEQTLFVPKAELGLVDTYVEIADWTAADFKDHPEVTEALIDHGHGDLVVEAAGQKILDAIKTKAGEILNGDQSP